MKTLFTAVTMLTCFLLLLAGSAMAKGIIITPGTRANAMGAAFVAVADDATAMYWNPAGLAQQKKSGAQVYSFYLSDNAKSNRSLNSADFSLTSAPDSKGGDFPLPRVYTTEPTSYSAKELKTSAFLPFAGAFTTVKDFTLGISYYGVGGGGGKWDDTVAAAFGADSLSASVDALYTFSIFNISVAKQINPRLSAGVGVDVVQMTDDLKVNKAYQKGPLSPLGALTDYSLNYKTSAKGTAFQFIGGILYKPIENLKTGFVFRSGTNIKLSGKGTYNQTGLAGLAGLGYPAAVVQNMAFETNYDKNYAYPLSCGIGVAYEATPVLTLAAGIDRFNYSSLKDEITYNTQLPGIFMNTNTDAGWKDVTAYRIGAEYRVNGKLAFQGGIQNDPVPFSTDKLTLLEINQYDFTYLCIGASYKISAFDLSASYGRGLGDKPSKAGAEYEYPVNAYRLTANYEF